MARRGRIIRMDQWDAPLPRKRLGGSVIPVCDMTPRPALHRIGELVYFSQFKRTKAGIPFSEIKQSPGFARTFAEAAGGFLRRLIGNTDGWCIITTPRRRHSDGFQLSTEVCSLIAARLGIPFYEGAVQCINRSRLSPDFRLLRPFPEKRVIIYDDIITTGMTLAATAALLADRDFVLNVVGISNR